MTGASRVDLPSSRSPLVTSVVGDVNGDGLEDFLFADPYLFSNIQNSPSVESYGRAYLFLGRTGGFFNALLLSHPSQPIQSTPADAVYQGFGLGASVAALGDIGGPEARLHTAFNDGYDDFAITRLAEDGQYAQGSVLVYFGVLKRQLRRS